MSGLSRREFLKLAGLVAAGSALAACQPIDPRTWVEDWRVPPPDDLAEWQPEDSARYAAIFPILRRLTYGPRPEDVRHAAAIGLPAWIEEQLAWQSIPDQAAEAHLRRFWSPDLKAVELADLSDKLFDDIDLTSVPNELRQATLLRQVYSQRQLYERMVGLWSDHFNISTDKGDCFFLKTVDDREVIRPHALGNFPELLLASAKSPAMLIYLDNQANVRGAPNENYARELLELHTLGVDGGYTQQDVMELARALTGWTVKERWWRGDFTFDEARHDPGQKQVLGWRVPGGQTGVEALIGKLALHPATAERICLKLARHFIADQPPADLVGRAARLFIDSQGQIAPVLRLILLDGLPSMQAKFRRPLDFVAASLRLANLRSDGADAVQQSLDRMGQPLFAWATPDGPPDVTEAWNGDLLARWQFAAALALDELPGSRFDAAGMLASLGYPDDAETLLQRMSLRLLGLPLSAGTAGQLLASLPLNLDHETLTRLLVAALLCSPAFQWR